MATPMEGGRRAGLHRPLGTQRLIHVGGIAIPPPLPPTFDLDPNSSQRPMARPRLATIFLRQSREGRPLPRQQSMAGQDRAKRSARGLLLSERPLGWRTPDRLEMLFPGRWPQPEYPMDMLTWLIVGLVAALGPVQGWLPHSRRLRRRRARVHAGWGRPRPVRHLVLVQGGGRDQLGDFRLDGGSSAAHPLVPAHGGRREEYRILERPSAQVASEPREVPLHLVRQR